MKKTSIIRPAVLIMISGIAPLPARSFEKIEIEGISREDRAKLDDIRRAGAEIRLAPQGGGRWKIAPTGLAVTPEITLPEAKKEPEVSEEVATFAFPKFVPIVEGDKTVLEPKLVNRWKEYSAFVGRSKDKAEIDQLVADYAMGLKMVIQNGDKKMYEIPAANPSSTLGSITTRLRDTLLDRAGDASDPLAVAALRTLASSPDEMTLQGLAEGMARVPYKAARSLNKLASGVGEVVVDGNASYGVCMRSSGAACITAGHVVRGYVDNPGALSVRFHVIKKTDPKPGQEDDEQEEMVSVTVKVAAVKYRDDWSPVALKPRPDDADGPLRVDCAFLVLDVAALSAEDKGLLAGAAIADVGDAPITPAAFQSARQFFQISYDPALPKVDGPQLQYRCALLCPLLTQSADDEKQVFRNLYGRCLIANMKEIEAGRTKISDLCTSPLEKTFLPEYYLPSVPRAASRYFAPHVEGIRSLAFAYEATSFKGDSGAPIFWYDESKGRMELIAVHMGGDEDKIPQVFQSKKAAYATPVYLIHADDRSAYCRR